MALKQALVHNNWDRLEEIWLGDVWPAHFYDNLEPRIRDSFYKITEWTKEDLAGIEKKFKEFNVSVIRPIIDENDKSKYLNSQGKLYKPPICPRDDIGVVGDTIYHPFEKDEKHLAQCYLPLFDEYEKVVKSDKNFIFNGANSVKLGQDIIIDTCTPDVDNHSMFSIYQMHGKLFESWFPNLRIHLTPNGGHLDGCFMPLRPGTVICNSYWDYYDTLLPGWEKIEIGHPSAVRHDIRVYPSVGNGRWHLGNEFESYKGLRAFNTYIEEFCPDWVGNFRETYFEVNIIMIDENNMMCINQNGLHDPLWERFEKMGINVHPVQWRTRNFWDGGLHCITLDTKRKAVMQDYFPNRGDKKGIVSFISSRFNNSTEDFFKEYNDWLKER